MSATHQPRLLLVDASSFLFRAFYGMPNLTSPDGSPSGAIYGVLNMLVSLMQDEPAEHIAVVFDAKGKTFRHEIYAQYKAHRPPMPDELRSQIEPLHEMIQLMGLRLIAIEGVEADDVIGTLSDAGLAQGYEVIIATGDKDMAQLVRPGVWLVDTMKNEKLDAEGVEQKFGLPPESIVDYLALMGDKSDNIPGVPGVGPKTAVKWLQTYGSLAELSHNAAQVKGKIGETLREHLHLLPLSQQLATIKRDCPLPFSLEELVPQTPDFAELAVRFERWGFRKWLAAARAKNLFPNFPFKESNTKKTENGENYSQKSPGLVESSPTASPGSFRLIIIQTQQDWQDFLPQLQAASHIALDTESTSLYPLEADLLGVSLCVSHEAAAYIPLAHHNATDNFDWPTLRQALGELFQSRALIAQNFKYDLQLLKRHGLDLSGAQLFDTMLESYIFNSVATRHNIDDLARHYLGYTTQTYDELTQKGKIPFAQLLLADAAFYAAEDAWVTWLLHQHFWPQLDTQQRKLYQNIEAPLVSILAQMEARGVLVDRQILADQSYELGEHMTSLEQQAYDLATEVFNLNSPKQLQSILYEKQQLPVRKKTPKGQPSTAEAVLQELADDGYALPQVIMQYRSLHKLKTTYLDALPKAMDTYGRIHTSYHQAVAATGRLSSSDPNLQNIPIRTPEGRNIRKAFIAPPQMQLYSADYSQIELRIMAHLSEDTALLQAFATGEDVHKATAAEIFGVMLLEVTPEMRRAAKAVNFGLIYGMSAFGLAKQLGIGRGVAQDYIQRYFERYPGVKSYMQNTLETAKDQGYVQTLFGRRLYLPDIHHKNKQLREYAERTAINAPLQGSAADLIKMAMIAVQRWLTATKQPAQMLLQVHDELVLEAPIHWSAQEYLKITMESVTRLKVPLVVDVGHGKDWLSAH